MSGQAPELLGRAAVFNCQCGPPNELEFTPREHEYLGRPVRIRLAVLGPFFRQLATCVPKRPRTGGATQRSRPRTIGRMTTADRDPTAGEIVGELRHNAAGDVEFFDGAAWVPLADPGDGMRTDPAAEAGEPPVSQG